MAHRRIKSSYTIFLAVGADERAVTITQQVTHSVDVQTGNVQDIGEADAAWESAKALAKGWTATLTGVLAMDTAGNYYDYWHTMQWLKEGVVVGFKLVETQNIGGVISPAPNGCYVVGNCVVTRLRQTAVVRDHFTFSITLKGSGVARVIEAALSGFDYALDFGLN